MRDVPLREDAQRYRENNDVQILATLRSLAINAMRLDEIWPIIEGIAALAHDIKGLLRLLGWRPAALTPLVQLLIGPACVPGSSRSRGAVPKLGSMSSTGFYTSGGYFLSSPSNRRQAIEKIGLSCPSGRITSGPYCLQ